MDGLFRKKSHLEMDDNWGYAHDFGNPQMVLVVVLKLNRLEYVNLDPPIKHLWRLIPEP